MSDESDSRASQVRPSVLLAGEAPSHWQHASQLPLVVVVGVTGVGKSTTLEHLAKRLRCSFLPDRRELADRVVIPAVQDEAREPRRPVRDRVERFRMTARYRERNPGGMAHALSLLRVDPATIEGHLVFDGLRGVDEIGWAIANLPRTRFLALRAPEPVRLLRLLGRAEGFDYAKVPVGRRAAISSLYAAVSGLDAVMSREELASVLESPALAGVTIEEIARKAAILTEEARNYDPAATLRLLDAELGPWRRLIINTAVAGPDEVAEQVALWLA